MTLVPPNRLETKEKQDTRHERYKRDTGTIADAPDYPHYPTSSQRLSMTTDDLRSCHPHVGLPHSSRVDDDPGYHHMRAEDANTGSERDVKSSLQSVWPLSDKTSQDQHDRGVEVKQVSQTQMDLTTRKPVGNYHILTPYSANALRKDNKTYRDHVITILKALRKKQIADTKKTLSNDPKNLETESPLIVAQNRLRQLAEIMEIKRDHEEYEVVEWGQPLVDRGRKKPGTDIVKDTREVTRIKAPSNDAKAIDHAWKGDKIRSSLNAQARYHINFISIKDLKTDTWLSSDHPIL